MNCRAISLAPADGTTAAESALDVMLADEGRGLLYLPFLNYVDGSLDGCHEMLTHPHTVPGLADGGAHVGTICDGSFPTYMLTHWTRDRTRGEKLSLPFVVKSQAADTARELVVLAAARLGRTRLIDNLALTGTLDLRANPESKPMVGNGS